MDNTRRQRTASPQRDKGAAVAGRPASLGSEDRSKRRSWSFINVSRSRDVPLPKRRREQDSPVAQKNAFDTRPSRFPASGSSSAPQTRANSPEPQPQPQPRPRSSRGPPSSRSLQAPNFSKAFPSRPASRGLPTILESKEKTASMDSLRSQADGSRVKRWEGNSRTTSPWNGIRKDSELFHEKGNCIVHLYAKGHSQRGPSIRIPLEIIYKAKFEYIFATFFAQIRATGARLLAGTSNPSRTTLCDLYIPPPDHIPRTSALSWHLTTRNFFAFLMGKPLVGSCLSEALLDLQQRLDLVRPNDPNNHNDLMSYFERSGYLEFSHCPDYSLAFLHFAERTKKHDLWVDAFVHSVGMNEMLALSPEFSRISQVTKALITRAYLEMDLHLGRVTRSLSNFLEEDFSPAYLGLSNSQRAHLDRFRSFLQTYYVEKFGYWPPPPGSRFSKSLYKSMYFDFRSLYDFLVDMDSSDSLVDQKPASGGICVLQNVQAFDARHKYIPLPHPQPLLPEDTNQMHRSNSQRALASLKLGSKHAKINEYTVARDALAAATNSADVAVTYAPLVKEYKRFERECARRLGEKVSTRDARKIRWIVVYGTLQMLVSVIRAPKEVRDVDDPTYPLCCMVSRLAPWLGGSKSLNAPFVESINIPGRIPADGFDPSLPTSQGVPPLTETPPPIQPDCEGDDYFTHTHTASVTEITIPTQKTPSKTNPTLPRTTGTFRNSSIKSVSSFSFSTLSSRRASKIVKPSPPAAAVVKRKHQPIVVLGYGNGLSYGLEMKPNEIPIEYSAETLPEVVPEIDNSAPTLPASRPGSSHFSQRSLRRKSCPEQLVTSHYGDVEEPQRTPTLDCVDIDNMNGLIGARIEEPDCASDHSNSTPLTPTWSSRSNSTGSNSSVDDTHARICRRASVSTLGAIPTHSTLLASPVELPIDRDGGVSRPCPGERRNLHELEIQGPRVLPGSSPPTAVEVDISVPQVYQPSGYRSNFVASNHARSFLPYRPKSSGSNPPSSWRHSVSGNLDPKMSTNGSLRNSGFVGSRSNGFGALAETAETTPSRTVASGLDSTPVSPIVKVIHSRSDLPSVARSNTMLVKELSTETKTALKSSLKRSDAVAGSRDKRRRSVRIKDEIDLLGGMQLNGIIA